MEDRYWLEFECKRNKLLIDFADIRAVAQINNKCIIYFYSDTEAEQEVNGTYRQVINKIKKLYASRYK
jgi:hypothetical protein